MELRFPGDVFGSDSHAFVSDMFIVLGEFAKSALCAIKPFQAPHIAIHMGIKDLFNTDQALAILVSPLLAVALLLGLTGAAAWATILVGSAMLHCAYAVALFGGGPRLRWAWFLVAPAAHAICLVLWAGLVFSEIGRAIL